MASGLAEQYREAKTDADQKAAPGKKRISSEAPGKKRSVAPDGTEYKKVRFEGEVKKWGKKQKAEVEFIDFIAANFSGNTVRVYESYKNAKGQYVYKDSNGKIYAAPNGVYIDSTGDIYLDLNTGNHGEGLVMNTFAHELYHHIERESPKKARKLAEFLVQELGYENVEIAVQRQIDKAKRAGHGVEYLMKENGISRTAAERLLYDRAFSDFVADSLETMFTKGNVVEALQKLKSQDAGLFNMIKSFIDKWVKRMRQFYRSHSTISIEGDIVSHLKKFEQIQQMFAEALVDAGEYFQVSKGSDAKVKTEPMGVDEILAEVLWISSWKIPLPKQAICSIVIENMKEDSSLEMYFRLGKHILLLRNGQTERILKPVTDGWCFTREHIIRLENSMIWTLGILLRRSTTNMITRRN